MGQGKGRKMRRVFSELVLLILLMGTLTLAVNIQPVRASGTIYIRADGSIDPPYAPISTLDNVTYTLTGNITSDGDGMVVERDNIVIDGAGQTLQGSGNGIDLIERVNVTIKGAKIRGFDSGVYLNNASFCGIYGNNITNNEDGVYLKYSSVNSISGNNITNRWDGIGLDSSSGNSISGNNITNNNHGIWLNSSSNYNSISGNNITANTDCDIYLNSSLGNSVSENNIANSWSGIQLDSSSGNRVSGNNVADTYYGIWLDSSLDNSVSGNNITAHGVYGISLYSSSGNSVSGNNLENTYYGIWLQDSSNNSVYHNNFVNNTQQAGSVISTNVWDDGSGGNYWSDYGADANHDGIGDTPYVIDANNVDHYPLMGHFESFNVSTWSHPNDGFEEVDVISNFTISSLGLYEWLTTPNQYLQAGQLFLRLIPAQGQSMTAGFCRITLPNNILNASYYTVLIDMTPIIVNKLAISNDTHTTLYFTFNTSAIEGIIIVPEFPSFLILPLFCIATLLTVIIYKKKDVKTSQS
jgi:parallel beta-helix repeat protein